MQIKLFKMCILNFRFEKHTVVYLIHSIYIIPTTKTPLEAISWLATAPLALFFMSHEILYF